MLNRKCFLKGKILLFIWIGVFWACSDSSREKDVAFHEWITFDKKPEMFIPDWVDSVSYLKLQNDDDAFISHISKVIIKNDRMYIGDFIHHKIVVYRMDGCFDYAIDRKGRGPEEYLEIKSFTVDDSAVYVLDNYNNSLHIYERETGAFQGRKKMPIVAWDVEALEEGKFVFAYSPLKGGRLTKTQERYRLFFTDQDLRVIKKMYPYSETETDPVAKNPYFSSTDREVVYNWCISDFFTVIRKDCMDSVRLIGVDFGKNKIPEVYRSDFDMENDLYHYLYATPVVNGKYIALDVSVNEYTECFLYDIQQGQWAANPTENLYSTLSFPDCCDAEGRFVYIIRNKEEYDELVTAGFQRADKEIEEHLEDGLAVLFYRMK